MNNSPSARLKVLDPGPLTSIQDKGRFGAQALGIGPSGAMDLRLLQLANALVGAPKYQAALEFWAQGPTLEVLDAPVTISIAADVRPQSQGATPVSAWQTMTLQPGEVISLGPIRGHRLGYIAVAGGLDLPPWMGSLSTHIRAGIGGFEGRKLNAGDVLSLSSATARGAKILPPNLALQSCDAPLRLVLGPQAQAFTQDALDTLVNQNGFELTPQSDRMGYRLQGPALQHKTSADIASDGMVFGSVQVPANGQPIVVLAERQTTGGYTKIATLARVDHSRFVQALPGQNLRFCYISPEQAVLAWRAEQTQLDKICADLPNRAGLDTASLLKVNLISGINALEGD